MCPLQDIHRPTGGGPTDKENTIGAAAVLIIGAWLAGAAYMIYKMATQQSSTAESGADAGTR
ncbi:hypothetical protein EF294_12665 [Gordonia oryzae]|uniref:Uncharacterized protein n=1 Tax=Gordonia oryzae TaxID=2487349 RepID=A0A3N4H4N7_9ACTN|nr:hypothetical protein [Gordonia oryzae]RPA60074.1 hypothetical protein EF294_12665 [Gordonia oryzae]